MAVCAVLACVTICHSGVALSQAARGNTGRPGGLVGLALNKAVQKELQIDGDTATIDQITSFGASISREMLEALTSTKGEPSEMARMRNEIRGKYEAELKKVLTAQQYTRLKQIQWQRDDGLALSDVELIAAIELTSEQCKVISEIVLEFRDKRMAKLRDIEKEALANGVRRLDPEDGKPLVEIGMERDRRLQEVLTMAQQKKFSELKGEVFTFGR